MRPESAFHQLCNPEINTGKVISRDFEQQILRNSAVNQSVGAV